MHTFAEYCKFKGGGGAQGGSADFAASAAPYVLAFHLAMGVRLVGPALSRFGARGGGRRQGGSLGAGSGEQCQGKVDAAVAAVPWFCWGGKG